MNAELLGANAAWVIATFILSMAVSHVGLIWWPLRLQKRGWRIVDYIWLLAGGIGLLGSVVTARQAVSTALIEGAGGRIDAHYRLARDLVRESSEEDGQLCRQFEPNEWMDKERLKPLQQDHDLACAWVEKLAAEMPEATPRQPINDGLLRVPKVNDRTAEDLLRSIHRETSLFNRELQELQTVRASQARSNREILLALLGASASCRRAGAANCEEHG